MDGPMYKIYAESKNQQKCLILAKIYESTKIGQSGDVNIE